MTAELNNIYIERERVCVFAVVMLYVPTKRHQSNSQALGL